METGFWVLEKARALEALGVQVLHFELGEPDFDTPANIVDAACSALRGGATHYGPAAGLPELRRALADHVSRTRGVPVEASEVIVAPGAKPIMFYAFLALLDEGDEVLIPDPAFPIYDSLARFCNADVRTYSLTPERGGTPDPAEIAGLLNPRTKLLVLNSPGNPTGGVTTAEEVAAIAAAVRTCEAWVLSDEIYREIIYEGEHHSILAEPGTRERTILLDGFSKSHAMTGWRLGWGVFPGALGAVATRLQINSVSCTATFSQKAALEAITGDQTEVRRMVGEFRRRREAIVAGLNSVRGFRCLPPHGAFYAFPDIRGTGKTSQEVADALMEKAGVACVSGSAFGSAGEGHVRFAFANSLENIGKASERMRGLFGAA